MIALKVPTMEERVLIFQNNIRVKTVLWRIFFTIANEKIYPLSPIVGISILIGSHERWLRSSTVDI